MVRPHTQLHCVPLATRSPPTGVQRLLLSPLPWAVTPGGALLIKLKKKKKDSPNHLHRFFSNLDFSGVELNPNSRIACV